jgi:hypothetical protein
MLEWISLYDNMIRWRHIEFTDSWLLIANEAAANLNSFWKQAGNSSEIYHHLTTSFINKESFLRRLFRWVIMMISRSTPLIAFGFEIWCDSLADFGCLQTGETIKRSIVDNYKTYKKLRATLGKIHISFGFSKDSTKTSKYKRTTHFLPIGFQGTHTSESGRKEDPFEVFFTL